MGGVRTFIIGAVMASSVAAAPDALTQRFAQCAGRMSAEMEFEWLMGRSGDEARLFRSHLEDVLEAAAPAGSGHRILNWRIEAKHAHASLLTRAFFNDNKADAARAARLSTQLADGCRALLTG